MSDNHQAHGSDNEQAAPVTPTMKRALAFIDLQASVESSSAEGSSATSLPTETTTASSPSAIPASNTQQRSAYVWPQPRRRPAPAAQTIDSGIRKTPAGIRALSVATQSSESAAASPQPTQPTRMIDQRRNGGFLGADAERPKSRKMKWTAENDRSLLLFGFGRDITKVEFQAIADWFKEKPTAKAVQERLTKLRAAGRKVLKESGIFDADASRDTPTTSRAPSVAQTPAPSQQSMRPVTPAPGLSSFNSHILQQPPPGLFRRSEPATPLIVAPSLGALGTRPQDRIPTYGHSSITAGLPSFSTPVADDHEADTSFPRLTTLQQQQELSDTYSQQHSSPTTAGPSQQRAGNPTSMADASMTGTARETADEVGGEEVDELRRSEMVFETEKARWEARKHMGGM